MSAKTEIHLRQCGKTFPDGTRALEPLDLTIAGGETLVLLKSMCWGVTSLPIFAAELADQGVSNRLAFVIGFKMSLCDVSRLCVAVDEHVIPRFVFRGF